MQKIEINQTIKSNETNGKLKRFGVTLDFLQYYEFEQMFQFYVQIIKDGNIKTQVPLKYCQPTDWTDLGDNYEEEYYSYFIDYLYCPDTTDQFQLNETFRSDTPDYLQIGIRLCQDPDPTICNQTKAILYLEQQVFMYGYAQIWVYILDKAIQADQKKVINYFVNIDTKMQITTKFGGASVVQHSVYNIETDTSIWPWKQTQTQSGILVDNIRNFNIQFANISQDVIAFSQFTMNQKKYAVTQKVGKIDQLFSYVGGLFSTIIAFLAFFLASYNQYKYELKAAEGSFNYDNKGRQIKQQQFNFIGYVKYTIYDWIKLLCCCQPNWIHCKEIDETRQQIVNQISTDLMLRRLCNIEAGLEYVMDDDEGICMSVLCRPSIEKVKQKHCMLAYYDEIIKGRCPLTLSNLKQEKASLSLNTSNQHERIASKIFTQNDLNESAINNKASVIGMNITEQEFNFSTSDIKSDDIFKQVDRVLRQFPQIKQQAQCIKIDQEFEQAQIRIAESFGRLGAESRKKIQMKIPILILYRVGKILSERQQKKDKLVIEDC